MIESILQQMLPVFSTNNEGAGISRHAHQRGELGFLTVRQPWVASTYGLNQFGAQFGEVALLALVQRWFTRCAMALRIIVVLLVISIVKMVRIAAVLVSAAVKDHPSSRKVTITKKESRTVGSNRHLLDIPNAQQGIRVTCLLDLPEPTFIWCANVHALPESFLCRGVPPFKTGHTYNMPDNGKASI